MTLLSVPTFLTVCQQASRSDRSLVDVSMLASSSVLSVKDLIDDLKFLP